MTRILTQDELDSLLVVAGDSQGKTGAAQPLSATPYNFRRQDRFSRDHIRSLRVLHDRFAKSLSTQFSAYLRAAAELTVVSIEQCSYGEYLSTLADPTAFYALSLAPFEAQGALEINPLVAFALIDRMMGGAGRGAAPNRAFTDIELNVVDSVVRLLVDSLTELWKPLVGLTFGLRARETRPQMLPVAAPDDPMVTIAIDARIGDAQGLINVCLPAAIVESSSKDSGATRRKLAPSATPLEHEWMMEHLSRVAVSVTPLIETRLAGKDVLALEAGDVLSLGLPVDEPITVRVGGLRKLRGRLVAQSGRAMLEVVGAPRAAAGAPAAGAAGAGDR